MTTMLYPCLEEFAKETGVDPDSMAIRWELEKKFHVEILQEADPQRRELLYSRFYEQAEPLVRPTRIMNTENRKLDHVQTFRRELTGKSVLDVGCGPGDFLKAIANNLSHGDLIGLDVVPPPDCPPIRFVRSSVIDFQLDCQVDVVFSDNVLEHLAPADLPMHLASVHRALKPGGKFIIIMPNKYFGPQDGTRLIDNSYTGTTPAHGCHLNESTNTEMVDVLSQHGFGPFQSVPHLKIGRRVPWRVDTSWMKLWEQSSLLLNLARTIRWHGRPMFKIPIILIATRGEMNRAAEVVSKAA